MSSIRIINASPFYTLFLAALAQTQAHQYVDARHNFIQVLKNNKKWKLKEDDKEKFKSAWSACEKFSVTPASNFSEAEKKNFLDSDFYYKKAKINREENKVHAVLENISVAIFLFEYFGSSKPDSELINYYKMRREINVTLGNIENAVSDGAEVVTLIRNGENIDTDTSNNPFFENFLQGHSDITKEERVPVFSMLQFARECYIKAEFDYQQSEYYTAFLFYCVAINVIKPYSKDILKKLAKHKLNAIIKDNVSQSNFFTKNNAKVAKESVELLREILSGFWREDFELMELMQSNLPFSKQVKNILQEIEKQVENGAEKTLGKTPEFFTQILDRAKSEGSGAHTLAIFYYLRGKTYYTQYKEQNQQPLLTSALQDIESSLEHEKTSVGLFYRVLILIAQVSPNLHEVKRCIVEAMLQSDGEEQSEFDDFNDIMDAWRACDNFMPDKQEIYAIDDYFQKGLELFRAKDAANAFEHFTLAIWLFLHKEKRSPAVELLSYYRARMEAAIAMGMSDQMYVDYQELINLLYYGKFDHEQLITLNWIEFEEYKGIGKFKLDDVIRKLHINVARACQEVADNCQEAIADQRRHTSISILLYCKAITLIGAACAGSDILDSVKPLCYFHGDTNSQKNFIKTADMDDLVKQNAILKIFVNDILEEHKKNAMKKISHSENIKKINIVKNIVLRSVGDAKQLEEQKQYSEAIKKYNFAIKLAAENNFSTEDLLRYKTLRGCNHYANGAYKQALEDFAEAAPLNKAIIHFYQMLAYVALGDMDNAQRCMMLGVAMDEEKLALSEGEQCKLADAWILCCAQVKEAQADVDKAKIEAWWSDFPYYIQRKKAQNKNQIKRAHKKRSKQRKLENVTVLAVVEEQPEIETHSPKHEALASADIIESIAIESVPEEISPAISLPTTAESSLEDAALVAKVDELIVTDSLLPALTETKIQEVTPNLEVVSFNTTAVLNAVEHVSTPILQKSTELTEFKVAYTPGLYDHLVVEISYLERIVAQQIKTPGAKLLTFIDDEFPRDIYSGAKMPKNLSIVTNATKEEIFAAFDKNAINTDVFDVACYQEQVFDIYVVNFKNGTKLVVKHSHFLADETVGDIHRRVENDIFHRDFTCNGLLLDRNKNLFVPFNISLEHINSKVLATFIDATQSFSQDCRRLLRGIDFNTTLSFTFSLEVYHAIANFYYFAFESEQDLVKLNLALRDLLTGGYAVYNFQKIVDYNLLCKLFPNISLAFNANYAWLNTKLVELDNNKSQRPSLNYIYMLLAVASSAWLASHNDVALLVDTFVQSSELMSSNFKTYAGYINLRNKVVANFIQDKSQEAQIVQNNIQFQFWQFSQQNSGPIVAEKQPPVEDKYSKSIKKRHAPKGYTIRIFDHGSQHAQAGELQMTRKSVKQDT